MRWKLLRRQWTISAPQMAVRSSIPWPIRWAGLAIMLGLFAVITLWTFELGKDWAGLDREDKEELARLRQDVVQLRLERDKAQSIHNSSSSLLTAERAAQEKLAAQIRMLESENHALRDELGFFEKLLPASGNETIAIRGLQAEVLAGGQLKWQVLVIQAVRNAPEFRGRLHLTVAGTLDDKPWSMEVPDGAQNLQFRQHRRLEGMVDLPQQAVVKNVSAKVVEGTATRAVQSIKLGA
ncbi:MAG: FIG00761799: membrane protein [uncultured Ramlibacter sp.]|uniref:FIG00761799: membrane protein n=1 Tax=uncultured Ramlibacter sp. TaxID=260755 RepID=A0A6J4NMQ6_9BURK|nr:MAG: FIG00761799: membrane protein [uncultured Ramlibacter sp.]